MLNIGSLKLSSNVILAPMAGITDLPFRMLNRQFGCELAFVEMINVRSISYKSKKTAHMLSTKRTDRPLGIQILGLEEKFIRRAIDILKKYKFDLLDFNAACPAKKVVRRGEGASLMRQPKKIQKLLKIVVEDSLWPVSIKIRAGWDKDSVNAKDIALAAEDAGVSAVFIHGRTKLQEYSGSVDYKIIREVKKAVHIPVIGSGDVLSAQLAKQMLTETGCDGIAVARGALGNPWIFREIAEFLESGQIILRPSHEEIVSVMRAHLESCIDFYGEHSAVVIFRKFFAWYTRGFKKIRPLREKCCRVKSKEEVLKVFAEL
ncbi:MAG: tRNA dihydrouridine synthase DusB [Candidatus Omnitrophica bacterium]|jgi:tRNA-dihydrouridine synthase B|nr:tRNA dihydrouridine synthase DusB [Candidatus Omnitrophota bacterium]